MNEDDEVIYTTLDLSTKADVESVEISIDEIDMTIKEGTTEWMQ